MNVSANSAINAGSGLTAPRSLSRQFALTGGLVMLVVMLFAGMLTSRIVTNATVENTATSTALFMDSFLSPHLQALAHADVLPDEKIEALNRLLGVSSEQDEPFENRFPHLEIWKEGGLVVYSRSHELVGRRFEPPAGLVEALTGHVSAQYADLSAPEHVERHFDSKYLEIYVPVREYLSGRIIAVAEIHETPDLLKQRLFDVRLRTWLTTALLTLVVMMSLFGIVHRGSRLIGAQHTALRQRIDEVRMVSDQNRKLREKAQLASSRLAELNASYLRNVGAELHDGPAQLVGLAALKVEHIRRAASAASRGRELQAMGSILADALRDIRAISKGLMLPEIEEFPLCEVVSRAVSLHEKRTGTKVTVTCGSLDCDVSHAVKICVYRFVQEGLSNAFRHARDDGHTVACDLQASLLTVAVQDRGGTAAAGREPIEAGLGLTGLRARVESLGGTFATEIIPERGTRIEMTLVVMGGD
jgi:signal transduction histidine kinase